MTATTPAESVARYLLRYHGVTVTCPDLKAATLEAKNIEALGGNVVLVSVRSGVQTVLYTTPKEEGVKQSESV